MDGIGKKNSGLEHGADRGDERTAAGCREVEVEPNEEQQWREPS
jgi:hypothetical protein